MSGPDPTHRARLRAAHDDEEFQRCIGVGLVALMLLLGACGGDDDASTPDTTEASDTTEAPDSTDSAAEAATTTTVPPATTTTTTMPAAILATESSIVAGEYEFAVTGAGIVPAVPRGGGLGMVPTDFGAGDQVLLVEFGLLSGDAADFAELEIMVTDGEGLESSAFLANGTVLESTTMIGSDAQYEFASGSTHSWAYAVPGTSTGLALVFPSGEVVDLSPILP